MKTITQSRPVCCAIPDFMLSRIGDSSAGQDVRGTLEEMRGLAIENTLIGMPLPKPRPEPRKNRNIYDARGREVLRENLVLSDHKTKGGDADARDAFDSAGAAWDLFHEVFGLNSIDGRGFPLDITIHYGTSFHNVMWNGEQVVCGDGGPLFNPITGCREIICHEIGHGLVQCQLGLCYSGEAGAVNEHFADVIGLLAKYRSLGLTAEQADWLIGAGLLRPGVNGKGIRSFKTPGKAYNDPFLGRDPQPRHLRDYVETEEDNGGVHINSGIPNHAFYLACMEVGGPAWEVMGRIWYRTLVSGLPDVPDFRDLAIGTIDMAGELYGYGHELQRLLADVWGRVGIYVGVKDRSIQRRHRRRPGAFALPQFSTIR